MTDEPSDRIFSFVFGFLLFGVPTFLIMGVLTGRVGPNLDSVFTWLVILLPTLFLVVSVATKQQRTKFIGINLETATYQML